MIRPLLVALCLALFAANAADPVLTAAWASPNDRSLLEIPFTRNALLFVSAGEPITLSADSGGTPCMISVLKDGTPYRTEQTLTLSAPQASGAYYISLLLDTPDGPVARELCVCVPWRGQGRKEPKGIHLRAADKDVGHYRDTVHSGNAKVRANPQSYAPPVWWFCRTERNAEFEIAPGLTAQDLVVPSEDTGLRHTDIVPVYYPLWLAFCAVRDEAVRRLGISPDAVRIISAFRAPPYNRAIGSSVFGRHIYGDAIDLYIDSGDGMKAADLNHDGRLDRRDAYPVVALIEDLMADGVIPVGGVGVYNTAGGDHEVTMHMDCRGHRATWGYRYGAGGRKSEFSWQSVRFADTDRADEQAAAARAAAEGRPYRPPHRESLQ